MDPNTLTLPQAAQSNDVMGALQKVMLDRLSATNPQEIAQRRTQTLGEYQNQLRQPAMGNYTPTMEGLYSMIDDFQPGKATSFSALHGIAQGGKMLAKQETLRQLGETNAAKVRYDDATGQDKLDVMELAGMRSLIGGRGGAGQFIQFKDEAGNLYIMNKGTGQREMIPAAHTKLWGDTYKLGLEKAVAERMENPEDYATQLASSAVQSLPGGRVSVDTVQKPTRPLGQIGPITPGVPTLPAVGEVSSGVSDPLANLKAQYDKVGKVIEEFRDNPEHPLYQQALENQAAIKRAMVKAPKMEYKDNRQIEQDKGYGDAEGKGLYKEYGNMEMLHTNSANLLNQLTLLKKMYEDPNLTEGQLAPYIHQIKSGLKSVGVDVGEATSKEDLASAIATKMSLAQRNADGQNLMPGSMTTFEEQLLMNMTPTLGLTSEGRKALADYMIMMTQSNMRVASEAVNLSKANKNRLPANWPERKERVMKEEMLKLRRGYDQLMKQFGGSSESR